MVPTEEDRELESSTLDILWDLRLLLFLSVIHLGSDGSMCVKLKLC